MPRAEPLLGTLSRVTAALSIFSVGSLAEAQRPKVVTYGIGQGLPRSNVEALAQSASGKIWILTTAGLTTFDGRSFRPQPHPGLPEGDIAQLATDPEGGLWTVMRRPKPAVFRLVDSRWQRLPLDPEGLNPEAVMTLAIAEPSSPRVAIGSGRGVWLWQGDGWRRFTATDGLPDAPVHAVAWVGRELAVGTESGLCVIRDGRADCSLQDRQSQLGEPILALHPTSLPDSQLRLWILSTDWLATLRGERLEIHRSRVQLNRQGRRTAGSLLIDPVGGGYFGVWQLLLYLGPGEPSASPLGLRDGLVSDGVKALLLDHESNVWVGTSRGLSKIESWRFLSFDQDSGLLEDEVTAIAEVRPGELVLGHNTGLTFLEGERIEHLPFARDPRSLPDSTRVMDLLVDEGELWIAAHRLGLLRRGSDRRLQQVLSEPIVTVALDSERKLWAGSFADLYVLEQGGAQRVEHGVPDIGHIRWITPGDQGRLYVSTAAGLLVKDDRGWRLARTPIPEDSSVYGVLAEPEGPVWVGCSSGLHRLGAGGQLLPVSEGALEVDRPIYFIFRGPQGSLWLGTDDGLFAWDGVELRHLTVEHGLIGRETNRGAGFVDHNDRIWIGTQRGVSLYRRAYDLTPRRPPRVQLSAISIGSQQRSPQGSLRLQHGDNNLTFHPLTIAFSSEQPVTYRYRLEGLEEAWQGPMPEMPAIRYVNVPPGSYRFRISASWAGGTGGPEASSGPILIAQPLWRRPWFVAIAALSLVAVVGGGHSLRTQRMRAHNLALAAANQRLQESIEERQHLIQELSTKNAELERFTYTISHDLKTPLVTINGFLGHLRREVEGAKLSSLEGDFDRIEAAVAHMRRLLDELVELARIGRLVNPSQRFELAGLAWEAVRLCTTPETLEDLVVVVDPELPVVQGDRERLLEVYVNLIENAIKFMGDEPRPRIEIGVRTITGGEEQPLPVYFVRDNGIGIDPRYHQRVFSLFERLRPEVEGTGVGLTLVQRIVELHQGQVWIESNGNGGGTTFCFTLGGPGLADPQRAVRSTT